MDKESKPKKELADELESLRAEIAQLQSLIQSPDTEVRAPSAPSKAEADEEVSFPPDLLDSGYLGMALVNSHFHITKANAAFRRMLGYSQSEINSLHIQDLAEDSNSCVQLITQIIEGISPVSRTEAEFIHRNGEKFWVQFTASAIPETAESREGCLIVIEDISDRKWGEVSLKAEKQLLERLINSSLDGIVAFDCDGFLTVWNPAMEKIFGVSKKDALGKPVFQACPFLVDLGEDVNIAAALSGKKVISRDKSYTIPGSRTPAYFEGYYGPMYSSLDGEVIGGLAIIRDVTERRVALEEKQTSEERYRELFENAYDIV